MATLDALKLALRRQLKAPASPEHHPLSEEQYSAGFDILAQETSYEDFVIPTLSQLLAPLFDSRIRVSVLEIGPGPKTVLGHLPDHMRKKIIKYTAFEPNSLFATRLEKWLCPEPPADPPFSCLHNPPAIHRTPFTADMADTFTNDSGDSPRFDLVLFCHSMYGLHPKPAVLRRALSLLHDDDHHHHHPSSPPPLAVVIHRAGLFSHLYTGGGDGLVAQHTATFPAGVVRVADADEPLDRFAAFVAGCAAPDSDTLMKWRAVCRALGRREGVVAPIHPTDQPQPQAQPQAQAQVKLVFAAPTVMAAFAPHAATALAALAAAEVPLLLPSLRESGSGDADGGQGRAVKNVEARARRPAAIARPTAVAHVQACVRWALRCGVGLTVVGGGHGGQCLWSGVVGVDMAAFDRVHVLPAGYCGGEGQDSGPLVVAGAGCTTGHIIRSAMAAGLTVPLGARPSVGAGLWLQGGIGHLARLHGLACDAVVGAVVVSVASGEVVVVGCVPSEYWPAGAVRVSGSESDLLWAIRGAGTNFGIVISVTFKAYAAPTYSVRNWVVPLSDRHEARRNLADFDRLVAGQLPRRCSADAYLYWEDGNLRLGVTMFEVSTAGTGCETHGCTPPPELESVAAILGPQTSSQKLDSVGVFDAEMYISGIHGGHGSGKTSSFKRCLFLQHIGDASIADILAAAMESRPTPLCYIHLLQGGGAVSDVPAGATPFGCRDWDFACVVTGVWPREQDGAEAARAAVAWVYKVAGELLPLSRGAYGADLGPDPRDAALAARAFGPNLQRLARLKRLWDPQNVLRYACPLPRAPMEPRLIVLVTGESGAGKDYSAAVWVSWLTRRGYEARAVSISEATKRAYAAATGADVDRLLRDRAYKEQHRSALTAFFQDQVRQRPRLPEEHFLEVVDGAAGVEVLFITGMRDEAPVATFSRLVPQSRLLEVYVKARDNTRRARGAQGCSSEPDPARSNRHRPGLVFDNDAAGDEAARAFAEHRLLPFLDEDLQRLAAMVRPVPGFPRQGIQFRHVLGIAQQPGGLALCAALLERHFTGRWAAVDAVACCEAGGFVFASALAARVGVPLALIRDAGKLPPPTVSVAKSPSHISSSASGHGDSEARIELERDAVPRGATVLVLDDVLATGRTLCAVLRLLGEAGVPPRR
ncbi:b7d08646-e0b9-4dc0-b1ae-f1f54f5fd463 [Thermothielavioides terrestris]|uniref:B7d08646-e0b9-4dc0-b1ae-f1f54f5fd463 n=1 Tax=Thermothielavioides terrestris TaxID=2587410 RepID=A0A3S4BAR1_9PEZI|nr:b7d08646-e0b9-4dc0-b1ae-f1f54f5fd463 [Thermothielavioides terrestris]